MTAPLHSHRRLYGQFGKRMVDLCLAVILLLPVGCVICALCLPLVLRGQRSFYGHERVGQHGALFRCWKIRTMRAHSQGWLIEFLRHAPHARHEWMRSGKLRDDPRVDGAYCAFLRASFLDELPQIWNILRGEMSFVGPRPMTIGEHKRHDMSVRLRPGLTGYWQLDRSPDQPWAERRRLNALYEDNIQFSTDCILILRTLILMVTRSVSSLVQVSARAIKRYVTRAAVKSHASAPLGANSTTSSPTKRRPSSAEAQI